MFGNDDAMTYEMFLRKAFGVKVKGGDPAHLASADTFEVGGINNVKTGTAYAMAIYINEADERYFFDKDGNIDANRLKRAETLQGDALNAENKDDIVKAIKDFQHDILHED